METVPYISLFALLRFIIIAAFFLTYIGMRSGWFRSFFHAANNIIIYVCLRLYSCSITILTGFQLALYFHPHFLYYVGEGCDSARQEWKWLTHRNKEKRKRKKDTWRNPMRRLRRFIRWLSTPRLLDSIICTLCVGNTIASDSMRFTRLRSSTPKADNRWTKQTRRPYVNSYFVYIKHLRDKKQLSW